MRGSETVKEDFKTQIFDIFGTVDLEQLRAIAQKVQLIESEKPHNERGAGRKNSLTPQQLAEMLALHQQGMGATELAKKYGISRQTIYKQLTLAAVAARAQNFINHLGIQCNLLCVPCPNRFFNGTDLLFHGGQIRKRKSRGNFFLCFAQILFRCCFS